jgi:hypothetical protein
MTFKDVIFKERIAPWWGARSSKPEGGVKRPWWVRFLPFSAIFEVRHGHRDWQFVARVAELHDQTLLTCSCQYEVVKITVSIQR